MSNSISYKDAGVDIDAGMESVDRIKEEVKSTFTSGVVTGLGSFGAMFDLKEILKNYQNPILVQSIDGVGTKLKIAAMLDKFDTVGMDIVNHCCDDILAQGAKPLTFLDYIAAEKLSPQRIEDIVKGMVVACKEAGVSLIGGEIAEMPGVYEKGEHDIAGCVLGVVDREKVIDGKNIKAGDVVIGLESNGLHTNGYSLARKLFFEVGGYDANSKIDELELSVGEELLRPHRNYVTKVLPLVEKDLIKGIAHITGGGFYDNIPRVLPDGVGVEINKDSFSVQPVFKIMQKLGNVAEEGMYRTFNMGIGMVLIVDEKNKEEVINQTGGKEIGKVIKGEKFVKLI